MSRIAILGGGPSALFTFKRLVESGHYDFSVDIYEKSGDLGCGMPYGHTGSADEHITNVSGNEIPELPADVADWIKKVPRDTLDKYRIDPERFNDYKVLPRLLFGQYLCDQFKVLLQQAKENGLKTQVYYHTTIVDIFSMNPKHKRVSHGFNKKGGMMPWYNGDYPPSYKNQPKYLRDKAVEIANEVLKTTHNEGEAIATGLKQARKHFEHHPEEIPKKTK